MFRLNYSHDGKITLSEMSFDSYSSLTKKNFINPTEMSQNDKAISIISAVTCSVSMPQPCLYFLFVSFLLYANAVTYPDVQQHPNPNKLHLLQVVLFHDCTLHGPQLT